MVDVCEDFDPEDPPGLAMSVDVGDHDAVLESLEAETVGHCVGPAGILTIIDDGHGGFPCRGGIIFGEKPEVDLCELRHGEHELFEYVDEDEAMGLTNVRPEDGSYLDRPSATIQGEGFTWHVYFLAK